MSENNTQLTSAIGYDPSNMRFSEPVVGSIPDSKPAISYRRINITTINPDGSEGELIIPTDEVFSYGVGENTNIETGKVNGYVCSLCLHAKSGATSYQKAFTDTMENIVDYCRKHLIDNRDKIEQYDLEMNDLKKLNPIYQKKEKGKVVPGSTPTLYAKLIVSKKQDKIISYFYDKNTQEPINALDLLGKYFYATAAIKIESIFIGRTISLQVKLYECEVRMTNTGMQRLLTRRPESVSKVETSVSSNPMDDDDDAGSIVADDPKEEENIEETIKEVPKKVVKKVVKKVIKKDA